MRRSIGLSIAVSLLLASCGTLSTPPDVGTGPGGGGGGGGSGNVQNVPSSDYSVQAPFSTPSANAAQVGQWSNLIPNWPTLAIHATLLPDGRVMTFGGNYYADWKNYAGKTDIKYPNKIDLWDPASGSHQDMTYIGSALFCGGHTLLPDGKLLVAGGDDLSKLERFRSFEAGIRDTNVYDYKTKSWKKVEAMTERRWYPTTTVLPNGHVLAVGGNTTGSGTFAEVPEVYNPTTESWRRLEGAKAQVDFYPWLFVASNGKVFNAGPDRDDVGWLDTAGNGSFVRNLPPKRMRRDYGTAVMYDQDKVLVLGGGGSDERGNTTESPSADTIDIDLSSGQARYTTLTPMQHPRRMHNATLLADGSVLVTGGTSAYGFNNRKFPPNDPQNPGKTGQLASVLTPELWNPSSKTWTPMAPMAVERLYHSTALLLPDATVLVSGGGACTAGEALYSGCPDERQEDAGYNQFRNAQVFKPPYLFKGARPSIQSVPNVVEYGQSFNIRTANADSIRAVNLIRLGSVTHSFDMNQRINKLNITSAGNGVVTVKAPENANVAPPGHYMLFILNGQGVPSVSRIIQLQ